MIQDIFIGSVIAILLALLIDGWRSGAVWVKGARDAPFSFRNWAHKRSRDEDPWPYWFAMSFYAIASICLVILIALR